MFYLIVHRARCNLGEVEQLVLLALMRLGEHAYGAAIRAEVLARPGRSVTPGAIYPNLDRLEQRGVVSSYGASPPLSGVDARDAHFTMTRAGVAEIRRAWQQAAALARGLEVFLSMEKMMRSRSRTIVRRASRLIPAA